MNIHLHGPRCTNPIELVKLHRRAGITKPSTALPGNVRRIPFILATALAWLPAAFAAAQERVDQHRPAQEKLAQEYVNPLKGPPEDLRKLTLIAPENREFMTLAPEGLRIRLPAGFEGERKLHGVNSGMIAQGDFEITASFEVLREPALGEAGDQGTKVHLLLNVNRPPWDLAGFSRHLKANKPTQYTAWRNAWDDATRKNKQKFKGFAVKGTKWRFRLTRTGATLSYFLAEEGDPDFRLLQQHDFPPDDVKDIRVVASTGGPLAALDVRITDLRIRAESLPNLPNVDAAEARGKSVAPTGRDWRIWLAAGVGVILLLGLVVAFWQSRRGQSRRAANAGAVKE
ncbi:MAG: DUF1583 domain-containing protein [Gemmataceae bacterium]|nr:DUF1583 domain-containing protein [Gemmataceae bacterium]